MSRSKYYKREALSNPCPGGGLQAEKLNET